jgi:hypothetical protein
MGIAKRIIRYRINSWFLSSQLGTVGHTLRDGSQEKKEGKWRKYRCIGGIFCEMAASPSKMTWVEGITWI